MDAPIDTTTTTNHNAAERALNGRSNYPAKQCTHPETAEHVVGPTTTTTTIEQLGSACSTTNNNNKQLAQNGTNSKTMNGFIDDTINNVDYLIVDGSLPPTTTAINFGDDESANGISQTPSTSTTTTTTTTTAASLEVSKTVAGAVAAAASSGEQHRASIGSHRSQRSSRSKTVIRKFQKLDSSQLSSTPSPDVKIGQRIAYKEYYGNEFGTIRWIGKLCLAHKFDRTKRLLLSN